MSEPKVEYVVRGFPKGGKHVAHEVVLKDVSVEQLRKIFDQPDDEPMVDVFRISEHEADLLRPFLSEAVDLTQRDYFLYCDAV